MEITCKKFLTRLKYEYKKCEKKILFDRSLEKENKMLHHSRYITGAKKKEKEKNYIIKSISGDLTNMK